MCPMGSNHSPREEQLVQIKCKDAKSTSRAAAEAGGADPEVRGRQDVCDHSLNGRRRA